MLVSHVMCCSWECFSEEISKNLFSSVQFDLLFALHCVVCLCVRECVRARARACVCVCVSVRPCMWCARDSVCLRVCETVKECVCEPVCMFVCV